MELEYQFLLPLIIISVSSVAAVAFDAIWKNKNLNFSFSIFALLATLIAAAYTLTAPSEAIDAIKAMALSDLISKHQIHFGGYSAYFDILFCLAGLLTIVAAKPFIKREYEEYNEFYSLILFSISGMMLISHSSSLLVLFIGIELMSIPFYVLAGFFRKSIFSVEASLKYFFLGAFATGFLLYGMAMLYGATGTLDIKEIGIIISQGEAIPIYLTLGIGLMLVGLSFKAAAFPFHQWAPDVYSGSPTVVSAFFATAGKAAAIVGFVIIAKEIIQFDVKSFQIAETARTAQLIIAFISAATMLIGNLTALVQKNVKRMLAYSSVAHAGYLLMGIVASNELGYTGIIFYISAYIFMQIGAFVIVSVFERNGNEKMSFDDYSGLYKSHPILSALMSIFMLSLAGIPPFAGFFGKYYLFLAAIKADFLWLTIVAVISSIISMYYYIGLILQMYFKEQTHGRLESKVGMAKYTLLITAAAVIIFGIFPSLIVDLTYNFF